MAEPCPQCGRENDKSAKFCVECGVQLRKVCKACSALIDVRVKFCPDCGKPQLPETAAPGDQSAADWHPVSERRQVTVMFLDLVGSTALSARFDAEDWRELLLSYQAACVRAIEGMGGRVSRYLGDGMMVYFGYPQAQEDAPQRAAMAGLAVLEEMEQLNESRYRALGLDLQVRIGIDVGRVVTGEMGAGSTRESMDIVGVTPNIAARLESLAPAGSVLVSAAIRQRIADNFELESYGRQSLKGIDEPIEVFKLLAPRGHNISTRYLPEASGHLFGREEELAALSECWRDAVEKRSAQLVMVEGEPGIGKSGLLQLFRQSDDVAETKAVVWACSIFDSDTPLATVWRSLAEEFGLQPGESEAETQARIDAGLAHYAGEDRDALQVVAAGLMKQIHRKSAGSEGQDSDAAGARRELFRALLQCLRQQADPMLLVLEDAHWADPSTLELVDRILRHSSDWAVMVLVLTRPSDNLPWRSNEKLRLTLDGTVRRTLRADCFALNGRAALREIPSRVYCCHHRRDAALCRRTDEVHP